MNTARNLPLFIRDIAQASNDVGNLFPKRHLLRRDKTLLPAPPESQRDERLLRAVMQIPCDTPPRGRPHEQRHDPPARTFRSVVLDLSDDMLGLARAMVRRHIATEASVQLPASR